jgi:hypothetical protein
MNNMLAHTTHWVGEFWIEVMIYSVQLMWPQRSDLPSTFDSPYLPSSSVSEAKEDPLKIRMTLSVSKTSEPESCADLEKVVLI